MIGNGPVRFGGGPSGKGPVKLEPRLTAYPARLLDSEALGQLDIPDHETAVEIPAALLKFAPPADR
jgi:hypothetical protein